MLIYLCVAIRIDVSLLFCLRVNYIIHINIIYIYIEYTLTPHMLHVGGCRNRSGVR